MDFKRIITLLVFLTSSITLVGQKMIPIGFENNRSKIQMETTNSSTRITKSESLRGDKSLEWRWKGGATLSFHQPIGYAPKGQDATNKHLDTFSFWIFNEKANKDSLKVSFLDNGVEKSYFYYHLNFTGWRTAWVSFDRDMNGTPSTKMDELQFVAPKSVQNGTFYLDEIITATPIDPRHHIADHQVPFVNSNAVLSANKHWIALEYFSSFITKNPITATDNVTETQKEGIHTIEQRLQSMFMEGADKTKNIDKWITKIRDKYEIYSSSNIKGQFVYFASYPALYSSEKKPTKHLSYGIDLKTYTISLYKIAQQYHLTNNRVEKKHLAKLFTEMVKNMRKYGWAAGSGQGTLHHLGYSFRDYYPAMFLMRESLEVEGLLDSVCKDMAWFSGLGKIIEPKDRYVGINVDMLNTTLMGNLSTCLMSKQDGVKVSYLNALQDWLIYGVDYVPGLLAPFKPDGSFFHHYNHYPLYAKDALDGSTPVFFAISKTPFALPEYNAEIVKQALLKMHLYSHNLVLPISMSGRHPYGDRTISSIPFYYMAKTISSNPNKDIDPELGSIYVALAEKEGKNRSEQIKEFTDKGVVAETNPQGNWSMNYASLNMHRKADWLFSVKGFNAYLWGSEIYAKANAYGRYVSYGHYQLQREIDGKEKTGFQMEGYDWNRYPGTTAIHLPLDKLAGNVIQVDHLSGYEELLISDEKFGASISMGSQGIYAMKLHEHDKYHGSHRATKSYFMFDDYVLMLGSDIENNVKGYNTETTLFQNSTASGKTTVKVNNQDVVKKGTVQVKKDETLILDNMSSGWYVPHDGNKLMVKYNKQDSKDPRSKDPNHGTFYSAWINHGVAPKNESYEYALLINTTEKELEQFAKQQKGQKNYYVAQKDRNAHIVKDQHSNTWGYAIFNNRLNKNFEGPLQHTNIPTLAMVKEGENMMEVEVCNPDLNLYQGKDFDQYNEDGTRHEVSIYSRLWSKSVSLPVHMTLSFKGTFHVDGNDQVVTQLIVNGNTEVTVKLQHGLSQHLKLVKIQQ
ncbi:hypothetical protein K4L44_03495 [Halosquirtibacter laminarini]|uniref:Uncharacterized protein n=1 Tax=Halosquirtibacter laminarini TaxID=3374600 RepID=A0AC61NP25_9BACT|nr:hypothetical protein K4L44_03495 [Prolixibacteraceae bacterium]